MKEVTKSLKSGQVASLSLSSGFFTIFRLIFSKKWILVTFREKKVTFNDQSWKKWPSGIPASFIRFFFKILGLIFFDFEEKSHFIDQWWKKWPSGILEMVMKRNEGQLFRLYGSTIMRVENRCEFRRSIGCGSSVEKNFYRLLGKYMFHFWP